MWRSSSEVDHDHPAPYMPDGRAEDPRIQDPHRIVRCTVVNRNDGGGSFQHVTDSLPPVLSAQYV